MVMVVMMVTVVMIMMVITENMKDLEQASLISTQHSSINSWRHTMTTPYSMSSGLVQLLEVSVCVIGSF